MNQPQDRFEEIRVRLENDVAGTLGLARVELVRAAVENLRGFQQQPDGEKLIEDVQQAIHDNFIDPVWPTCPRHRRHPLWYSEGQWWCAADRLPVVDLGDLPRLLAPSDGRDREPG